MPTTSKKLMSQVKGGSSHGNVRKYLGQYEKLQKLLDARETRKALVEFRHNALKKQRKHNYQLEYDRIRSVLGQNLVPNTTRSMIQNRMKDLEELGARAVNKLPN